MSGVKNGSLIVGPVLAAGVGLAGWLVFALPAPACWTAAVTALCAVWWIAEPIPIPATSLIPFALFPVTGVLNHQEVAAAYGDTIIMLFLGGFLLSSAMERSGVHRRLALGMLRLVGGGSGRRVVWGFMLATAVLSMWLSNTATVLMILPIAAAVVEKIEDRDLAASLMLGVTYAASIGGLATPVGTPPNLIFMGVYRRMTGTEWSFIDWMKIGVPVAGVFLPLAWLWLTRRAKPLGWVGIEPQGPWRPAERRTLIVFGLTALAWVTRTTPAGGWSAWLNMPGAGDSTVALVAAATLFLIPDGTGSRLVDWKTAQNIPWGLLLLFGGGIAIAVAFDRSGLSTAIGEALGGLTAWPAALMVLTICLVTTFMTEVTSNTAVATLLMPVLGAAALAAKIDPAVLMIPGAISSSCSFMLPVATPPNAIVMATGHVTIRRMAREGLVLNFLGVVVVTVASLLLIKR